MTALRATVSKQQLTRLSVIALITNGLALWSFYDGLVGYPRQRERALVYKECDEADDFERWRTICAEKGWKTSNPGEPKTDADIQMQFLQGGIAGAIGLFVLYKLLRTLGRTLEGDEEGIKASWGPAFRYDEVTQIDKKKWDSKGIAKIRYQQDGKSKTFILDDYIFERQPTDAMMRRMEAVAGVDKIVNGAPEPLPEEAEESGDGPRAAAKSAQASGASAAFAGASAAQFKDGSHPSK